MLTPVLLVLIAAAAYVLGSVNGSIIVSRYLFHSDVRTMGSGNAGLTNFYRNYGPKGIAGVLGIDIAKGVLAALIGGLVFPLATGDEALKPEYVDIGRLFATFCLILGHVFPVFYGFRGGKGILCGVSAVFIVDYNAGVIALVVFVLAFLLTRYVSLGSVLGTISVPVTLLAKGFSGLCLILACLSVLLVIMKHGENIVRIIRHKEPRFVFRRDLSHKLDEDNF
ncbi:MAG: glycerol-3-phosphate acyltransferase [Oscillospiraceae bacterium]|nr:glycerol-3-phosphate acyltransferase [Oscillospiraceae bacterium]